MNNQTDFLYRYETYRIYDGVDVVLYKFKIIRYTPKGYWIDDFGGKKWVSNYCKKRFAYPTKEDAEINFLKRTARYIEILEEKINVAKTGLKIFKNEEIEELLSSWI